MLRTASANSGAVDTTLSLSSTGPRGSRNGGTLSVSNDANLGDASNTVTLDGGTLENTAQFTTARNVVLQGDGTFQTDAYLVESGVISGSGGLVKTGNSALVLTGDNTFTGGITISGGTLQIGDGGTTGSITGDVTDNGTLAFIRNDNVTFDGTISGSGTLVQSGAGTLTLTSGAADGGGGAGRLAQDIAASPRRRAGARPLRGERGAGAGGDVARREVRGLRGDGDRA